jgi:hypothetical protein
MPTHDLDVRCEATEDGWRCYVTVGADAAATHHEVTVDRATVERLAPGAPHPTELVRSSFRFLLEREQRESILRTFNLEAIARYFPEWEAEIRMPPSGR